MRKHILWLISGIVIGTVTSLAYTPALAQAIGSNGTWQLGVSNWNQVNSAWRINTATGAMELCSAYNGKPDCFIMPKPSN